MRNRVILAIWDGARLVAGEPVVNREGLKEWKRFCFEQSSSQGSGAEILPYLQACVAWPIGSGIPLIGVGALQAMSEGIPGWWRKKDADQCDQAWTWLSQTFLKQILNQCGDDIPYLLWLSHPSGPADYQLARLTALAGMAVAPGGLLKWEQSQLLLDPERLLPDLQKESCWYWLWDDSGIAGLRWQRTETGWQVTMREHWPEFGCCQLEMEVSQQKGWDAVKSYRWLQGQEAIGWWQRKANAGLQLVQSRLRGEEVLLIGDNWSRGGQLPTVSDELWLQNLMLAVYENWQEEKPLPGQVNKRIGEEGEQNWRQLYLREKDKQQELLQEMITAKKQMARFQGMVEILEEENQQLRSRVEEMERLLEQREKKLQRLERRIQQGGM